MCRRVGFFLVILCASHGLVWARWDRFIIGPGGSGMATLFPGDGRNSGVQRIYAACMDGHIYEFSDSASQWYRRDIGAAGNLMPYVCIGRGRNDTLQRAYGASNDYNVYEFTYHLPGDYWTNERLGGGGLYMNAVQVGVGRNDNVQRVYGGCFDGYVYEFTRQGNGWVQISFPGAQRIDDIAVGFGRGDTTARVYSAGYYGELVESTYDTLGWTSRTIWNGSGLQSVAVGRGRLTDTLSDRRDHVYIGAMNGGVYELLYSGGNWTTYLVGLGGGGMYSVAVGPGRGDSRNHVYAGCADGKVYEFTFNSGWLQDTVGSANGHIDGVAVGRMEVDGVYATSYDGRVYGFRYQPSGVESQEIPKLPHPGINLTAFPNPFQTRSLITFSLPREDDINLEIYGLDGRRIRSMVHSKLIPGTHQVIWDGCDGRGSSIGPGVYFLRLRTTEGALTTRLLKLK